MQSQYTAQRPTQRLDPKDARPLLIAAYGNVCLRCGLVPEELTTLAVDHIVPIARGGQDVYENFQLLCGSCNSWKGTQVIDFRPDSQSLDLIEEREIVPLWERGRQKATVRRAPSPGREWVSVKQAAIQLSVSESSIRRMIRDGSLVAESIERPGGTLLRVEMPLSDDSQESNPQPEAAQGAVTALTDMLADEREERQRLAAENRTLAERAAAAEADARHLADRLADERERRLAAEQERDRLRLPWWRRIRSR